MKPLSLVPDMTAFAEEDLEGGLPIDVDLEEEEEEELQEPYDFTDKYWLAQPMYSDEYATSVLELAQDNSDMWGNSRVGSALWKAYNVYHNTSSNSQLPIVNLQETGEDGELLSINVNMYRNLVRHMLTLAASQRPSWDPQARTTDSESMKQVALARQILDFVMSAKGLEKKLYEQAEAGFVLGSAYIALGWDPNAGRRKPGEEPAGDITSSVLMPWEITHERTRNYDDVKWWIFSQSENRWDWVARLATEDPEKAEKLANLEREERINEQVGQINSLESPDRITLWYVYAMPSSAIPNGRMSIVASGDLVLFDGPYPFGDAQPIVRMAPNTFLGTSEPYADSWSLLSVNDAYNDVLSCMLTRVDAFGVPNITKPHGTELEAEDVGGMRMLEHPIGSESPKVLDLLTIPAELPNMLQLLEQIGENLSGVNSVARGNPAANIKSGAMAALVQSMAIQYNSALERAVNQAAEEVGTSIIRIYQAMASDEQLISICGEDKAWTASTFTSESIKDIQRVSVKTVSSLQKTSAFRMDMADKLLEKGAIATPQEYYTIVATGNIDPLFTGPVNALSSIKAENENMARGIPAKAMIWENHELHMREHFGQIDARMKENPEVFKVFGDHMMEHYQLWVKISRDMPDACAAMGIKPLPQAAEMGQAAMMNAQQSAMGPAAGGGAPPPGPAPVKEPETQGGGGGGGGKPKGSAPSASGPRMPKPAANPMDGKPQV